MAEITEFNIGQGETFKVLATLENADTGGYLDTTNYTFSGQVRENFTREILYYCGSKSECSYVEAREQFARRVLESRDYYNGHIQVRVHGSHIINKI